MKKNIVGYVCFGEVNTPIERLQMKHDEALEALKAKVEGVVYLTRLSVSVHL